MIDKVLGVIAVIMVILLLLDGAKITIKTKSETKKVTNLGKE